MDGNACLAATEIVRHQWKKVQSIALNGSVSSKTIDLTGHSKGIYLLNLSFEGKSYSKKLILE